MKLLVDDLEKIVKALNFQVTCSHVYELMSTGIVAGIVASFIPGEG